VKTLNILVRYLKNIQVLLHQNTKENPYKGCKNRKRGKK
jgi:hypothetical protein